MAPQKQYLDDSGNPAAAPAKTYLDDSGNAISPSAPAPDFTSNPHSEGLYAMQGPQGAVKVPHSKVAAALQSGYHLDAAALKEYAGNEQYRRRQAAPHVPEARTAGNYAAAVVKGTGEGVRDDVQGLATTIRHPVDTAKNLYQGTEDALTAAQKEERDLRSAFPRNVPSASESVKNNITRAVAATGVFLENAPMVGTVVQQAESGDGLASPESVEAGFRAGSSILAPEALKGVVKGAPKAVAKVLGPKASALTDLVDKTRGDNAVATKAADEANATQAEKDKAARQKVRQSNKAAEEKHAATKADVEAANREAVRAQQKIAPTEENLQQASEEMRGREETARENALKEGNEKYNTIRESLNPLSADMEKIHGLYHAAHESFGELQAEPPLVKRLGKELEHGEELKYKDLQSLYSELGKELSKGTLLGSTFHSLDLLHEGLGEDMQRIADSQGMGAQLTDARNYWRRMKQTFGKPQSFTDNASAAVKGANPDFLPEDMQANRLRLLGSFDPEIPKMAEHIANLRKGLKALPKPAPIRDVVKVPPASPEPTPLPKPTPPKVAETKTIGPDEVQDAKAKSLAEKGEKIHNRVMWATVTPTLMVIERLVSAHGISPTGIGEAALGTVGMAGVSHLITKLFSNPSFVDFMTKATPEEAASIPPEIRGNFPAIVKAAQSKGINVSPALLKIAGVGTAAAAQGPNTRKLQELRGNAAASQ